MRVIDSSAEAGSTMSGHQINEAVKKIHGIMGAGRMFRMVLHRKGRMLPVPHALKTAIIEIDMCHLNCVRHALRVKTESVILGGDLHLTGL